MKGLHWRGLSAVVVTVCTLGAAFGAEEALTVDQAVALAWQANPQVSVSVRKVEAARARVDQAWSQSHTTVSMNARYTRQGPTVGFTIPGAGSQEIIPADSHSLGLHAQRVVYSGGRLQRLPRAAAYGVTAAEHDVEATRQSVALQVKQAYYGVLKARRFQQVAEDAVKQAQEHLRISQVQFDKGAVAKFEVIRSEVAVANAEQDLVEAQAAVHTAEAAFNTALSRPLDTPVTLAAAGTPPAFNVDLSHCQQTAVESRPELKSLAATEAAAAEQVEVAKAGKKPSLVLSADYNHKVATAFGEAFDWNATLAIQLPILDGQQTEAKTAEAESGLSQIADSRQQLLDGIAFEVKRAYLACEQSFRRLSTAAKTIEQASEALRIAQVRYANDMGTNLEVTDAELALTQTKVNETRAIYDYYLALADLEHAVGQSYAKLTGN